MSAKPNQELQGRGEAFTAFVNVSSRVVPAELHNEETKMAQGKRAFIRAWQRAVRDNRELKPTNKLVLYTLSVHSAADGTCSPSSKQIAEECGLSTRSIRTYLRLGRELGFLAVEKRFSKAGRRTNLYQLPIQNIPRMK